MKKLRVVLTSLAALLCIVFAGSAHAAEFEKYGIESVGASLSDLQAGAHAETETSFKIKADSSGSPFGATHDLEVRLPPGLVGNVGKFPQCTMLQFENQGCPIDSQVGTFRRLIIHSLYDSLDFHRLAEASAYQE